MKKIILTSLIVIFFTVSAAAQEFVARKVIGDTELGHHEGDYIHVAPANLRSLIGEHGIPGSTLNRMYLARLDGPEDYLDNVVYSFCSAMDRYIEWCDSIWYEVIPVEFKEFAKEFTDEVDPRDNPFSYILHIDRQGKVFSAEFVVQPQWYERFREIPDEILRKFYNGVVGLECRSVTFLPPKDGWDKVSSLDPYLYNSAPWMTQEYGSGDDYYLAVIRPRWKDYLKYDSLEKFRESPDAVSRVKTYERNKIKDAEMIRQLEMQRKARQTTPRPKSN